jgi:hypothetical protein
MLSLQKKLGDVKSKRSKIHVIQINPSDFSKMSTEAARNEEVKRTAQKYMPAFDKR